MSGEGVPSAARAGRPHRRRLVRSAKSVTLCTVTAVVPGSRDKSQKLHCPSADVQEEHGLALRLLAKGDVTSQFRHNNVT